MGLRVARVFFDRVGPAQSVLYQVRDQGYDSTELFSAPDPMFQIGRTTVSFRKTTPPFWENVSFRALIDIFPHIVPGTTTGIL